MNLLIIYNINKMKNLVEVICKMNKLINNIDNHIIFKSYKS